MRWDELFADLEGQAEAFGVQERAAEVEEQARAELGRVGLVERLVPSVGAVLTLRCSGGLRIVGMARSVGPDWLLIDEGHGREAVVNLAHVQVVAGVVRLSAAPGGTGAVESRLALRSTMRAIARDRSPVRLFLADAGIVEGTIDRVGGDFVELAEHTVGELRRRAEVRDVSVIALAAVAAIRRQV